VSGLKFQTYVKANSIVVLYVSVFSSELNG